MEKLNEFALRGREAALPRQAQEITKFLFSTFSQNIRSSKFNQRASSLKVPV